MMKKTVMLIALMLGSILPSVAQYVPSSSNLEARQAFNSFRFGIFIHWGIYSEFGQGEWYLHSGKLTQEEYSKATSCFYPIRFDARQWVKAIKDSGAKYITFTSRHHDGFSMWKTAESGYNIVDATPFKRDVIKELSEACMQDSIRLHLYYSLLDWAREDYPLGTTGAHTGRDLQPNYDSYFQFMKNQLRELLSNYRGIGALWFDGYWDHKTDLDWRMPELYHYVHQLNPACLIGNNHHIQPIEGEDFQMFERDLPGENKAGFSPSMHVSDVLPLEMCQTMNGMWGYKVADQNYKSSRQLIQLIVKSAAKGSNLLLNIGPQPNGELPQAALQRLQEIGQWMRQNGTTIYDTQRGPVADERWGVSTQRDNRVFLHVLKDSVANIQIPLEKSPRRVVSFTLQQSLKYTYDKRTRTLSIDLPERKEKIDYIVEIVR